MDNGPGFKYIEKLPGGVQRYLMESKTLLKLSIPNRKKEMEITYHSTVNELCSIIVEKKIIFLTTRH